MKTAKFIIVIIIAINVINNLQAQQKIKEKPKYTKQELKQYSAVELLDSIAFINKIDSIKSDSIKSLNSQINNLKNEFKVETFLKINDNSIFGKKFQPYTNEDIPNYCTEKYYMVTMIHDLDSLLSNIEVSISETKVYEVVQTLNISKEAVKSLLWDAAKKDLKAAEQLIETIDKLDKKYLSLIQQNYYRPELTDKYNGLLDKIYSNK